MPCISRAARARARVTDQAGCTYQPISRSICRLNHRCLPLVREGEIINSAMDCSSWNHGIHDQQAIIDAYAAYHYDSLMPMRRWDQKRDRTVSARN